MDSGTNSSGRLHEVSRFALRRCSRAQVRWAYGSEGFWSVLPSYSGGALTGAVGSRPRGTRAGGVTRKQRTRVAVTLDATQSRVTW
jgi:hypothetical protein